MRIYFDENFSPALVKGLRCIQDGRRSDDITVCSVVEEFGKSSPDEIWIPNIAKKHGVVITQDININRLNAQWQLCKVNRIGVFFVKPPKRGWDYWYIVRLVIGLWPEITKQAKECTRPFGFYIEAGTGKMKPL
jgi:hypothetical protein